MASRYCHHQHQMSSLREIGGSAIDLSTIGAGKLVNVDLVGNCI